jgi:deoxyribodipyrimidine photolyase
VIIFTVGKKLPWSTDREKFEAWAEGRTGVPFVDANMRELKVDHFLFWRRIQENTRKKAKTKIFPSLTRWMPIA